MAQKIAYQSPKWEKELKNKTKVWEKQDGQMSAYSNLMALLKRNEQKESIQRDYRRIYSHIYLSYKIIAENLYLKNPDDVQCVEYCFLSGLAGVFAYLFRFEDAFERKGNEDITETKNSVKDFAFSLLQLYAVKQIIPPCVKDLRHLYISLFAGDLEKAHSIFLETESEFDLKKPTRLWIGEIECLTIQAIMDKDEHALYNSLIQHVKNYRKCPVGYSTFIDIYSIAYTKLAHQCGMNFELDIIEVPKMFFDDTSCRTDTMEIQLPFYKDAVEQLKRSGINWMPL